jgi:hypothetical protein
MSSRLWRLVHPLLTLAAVGCCAWFLLREYPRWNSERNVVGDRTAVKELKPLLHDDSALRYFLDVKSVGGTCEMPEGHNWGVIALLLFENGKFSGGQASWHISGSTEGTRTFSYQILWGKGPDGEFRVLGAIGAQNDTLWQPLRKDRGQFFSRMQFRSITNSASDEVRGYRVLAFGTSQDAWTGRLDPINEELKKKQDIVIVGLKTFPTQKESMDWHLAREPGDP